MVEQLLTTISTEVDLRDPAAYLNRTIAELSLADRKATSEIDAHQRDL
ncbi:hypothetical protein [Amycolatopsis sp. cmx-11-12]